MTNRERLQRVLRDLEIVLRNDAISPTPASHLIESRLSVEKAAQFALDMDERDGIKKKASDASGI